MTRKYKLEDGAEVPLFEADYQMAFKVFRSDRRKSVIGSATACIEAKGLCRLPNVEEAYIGSGHEAVVVFKRTASRPFRHAVHFIISGQSGRVRDAFDMDRSLRSQILMLLPPTPGRTFAAREKYGKAWREAVKNGKEVKPHTKPNQGRMERIGVAPRPRAKIAKGTVSLQPGA